VNQKWNKFFIKISPARIFEDSMLNSTPVHKGGRSANNFRKSQNVALCGFAICEPNLYVSRFADLLFADPIFG
jgi:hypothetical protein